MNWDDRYRDNNTPWDTGRPSAELIRVVYGDQIHPCRVIEFGCGEHEFFSGTERFGETPHASVDGVANA